MRLERCLTSIHAAALAWGGPVEIVVGADACTDGTAGVVRDVVAGGIDARLVEGIWRRPGRVRRELVAIGREELSGGGRPGGGGRTHAHPGAPPRGVGRPGGPAPPRGGGGAG